MRSPTRDRQLISIFSALALHVVIVLLLGLVDIGRSLDSDTRLGPVAVRFEPVPPQQEPLEQKIEPPAAPEEATQEPAQEPTEVPAAEEAQREQAPPAASQRTGEEGEPGAPAAPQQKQTQGPSRAASAEEEWTIPTPSGTSSDDYRTERRRTPYQEPSQEAPASRSREAETTQPVAPEQQEQRSEGSRIVYGEEERAEQTGTGRQEAGPTRPEPQTESPDSSVFSEELMQDLESVRSGREGESQGEGATGSQTTDEAAGNDTPGTPSRGPVPYPSEGSSQVAVEFEGERTTRTLKEYSLPELTEAELAELPRRVEVVVSFTLPPNGRPTYLQTERSSGILEVDIKVKQAVRTWTFSEAPENSDPVEGKARIVIRAAE